MGKYPLKAEWRERETLNINVAGRSLHKSAWLMKSGKKPLRSPGASRLQTTRNCELGARVTGHLVMLSFCSQGDWARVRGQWGQPGLQ